MTAWDPSFTVHLYSEIKVYFTRGESFHARGSSLCLDLSRLRCYHTAFTGARDISVASTTHEKGLTSVPVAEEHVRTSLRK